MGTIACCSPRAAQLLRHRLRKNIYYPINILGSVTSKPHCNKRLAGKVDEAGCRALMLQLRHEFQVRYRRGGCKSVRQKAPRFGSIDKKIQIPYQSMRIYSLNFSFVG